jgi:hypothetical protein
MQADFGFPTVPTIRYADNRKTADELWLAIPIEERFELLATIREMREWRGKPSDRPIRPAAIALHQWLKRETPAADESRRRFTRSER